MTSYRELNDFVNETFFDGKNESRPVYLSLEDDDRERLAELMGVDLAAVDKKFGGVVRGTLDFSGSNTYKRHAEEFKEWQKRNFDTPPPFAALLLALTFAAERMRSEGEYSANNYYQRLFEVLGITDEEQQQKIRNSGKHTRQLWWALNLWLTEYDYALGKPTARQVNNWTYVSYALSQSLVRLADRRKFHDLFVEFGLSPSDRLSEQEMLLYLHEWMGGHGPSTWLKRLWNSPDLRERVAGAAIDELDHWDGRAATTGENQGGRRRLSWVAIIKRFPRKRVHFYLARSAVGEGASDTLALAPGSTALAREAVSDAGKLWFEELSGTNLEYLAPVSSLKLGALFLTSVELYGPNEQEAYTHESRPVMPYIKDESGPYFREVARISLHASHLIMCHSKWVGRISEHLKAHARVGFECLDGDNSNGIPDGWSLFLNIEILTIPTTVVSEDLTCLIPLSTGATIQLGGGLKLAHNIWHASSPPEVLASSEDGILEVQLQVDDVSRTKQVVARTTPSSYDAMFIRDSGVELDAQNLKVVGVRNDKPVVERTIAFRSARTPRRKASLESSYKYVLNSSGAKNWGVSATPEAEIEDPAVVVEGMTVSGPVRESDKNDVVRLEISIGGHYQGGDEEPEYNMQAVSGDAATCILRGHHYFICPPQVGMERASTSRKMKCKDCSVVQIANKPGRRRKNKRGKKMVRVMEAPRLAAVSGQMEYQISADSVFDAICYLGSGTWSSLEPILSTLVSAPWEISIVGSNFVDLGHIDVQLDTVSRRPLHWSCPPPMLVVTDHGTAFLSGFREVGLLKEIKASLGGISGRHEIIRQERAPISHVWRLGDKSIDEIREAVSGVEGPLGRPIEVLSSPGIHIASHMPSVCEIESVLSPIEIDSRDDIERFDPKSGRWEKSPIDRPGSYRASFRGRRYFHRSEDGTMRETGYEIAKLLAARQEQIALHSYDPSKRTFECLIGCPPPGLYRRALVSCSGVLGTVSNGRLVYENVPQGLGYLILSKLYRKESDA